MCDFNVCVGQAKSLNTCCKGLWDIGEGQMHEQHVLTPKLVTY